MVSLALIEAFFFEASLAGWVAGGEKIVIPAMPGFKTIRYQNGDFSFLDCYSVTPDSLWSTGMTMIWANDKLIWYTSYNGYYDKGAIVFLRHVLLKAYETGEFFGGRGPLEYEEGLFVYRNHLCSNDFTDFAGREEIFSNGTSRGWHEFCYNNKN